MMALAYTVSAHKLQSTYMAHDKHSASYNCMPLTLLLLCPTQHGAKGMGINAQILRHPVTTVTPTTPTGGCSVSAGPLQLVSEQENHMCRGRTSGAAYEKRIRRQTQPHAIAMVQAEPQ